MKTKLHIVIIVTLSLVWLILPQAVCFAETYYVDATNGTDTNDGTSPGTAWRTIGRVNNFNFQDGDAVLFKRGEEFNDSTLRPRYLPNNFIIADYGTGDKPWINGNLIQPMFLQPSGTRNNIFIRNIDISGHGWTDGVGFNIDIAYINGIFIDGVYFDGHKGWDGLGRANYAINIYYYNREGDIEIKNCEIKNVGSLDILNSPYDHLGIIFRNTANNGENILIRVHNNTIHDTGDAIQFYNCNATTKIYDNVMYNCGEDCLDLKDTSNVEIYNNTFYRTDDFRGFSGQNTNARFIVIHECNEWATASNNVIRDNYFGPADNSLFDAILIYGYFQGQALPGANNISIFRNTFENHFHAVTIGESVSNISFFNNLLINSSIHEANTRFGGNKIYGNTIYNGKVQLFYCTDTQLRNNIVYTNNADDYPLQVLSMCTNPIIDHNIFYNSQSDRRITYHGTRYDLTQHSQWVNLGHAGDIFDNPLFVSNNNYHLRETSPAIDAGVDVGLTKDFDGNSVPQGSAPDIGAYEYVSISNLPPDVSSIPDVLTKNEGQTINAPEIELATDPDGDSLTYTYSGWPSSLPYTTTYNDVGTHTLHLDVTDGTDTVGKDITVTVASLSANVWFVRPRTGEYGVEDGTSYETAWDGVNSIIWGEGGVDVGDTLYVCGTFDRDGEANPSALIDIKASGVEGHPITIRGDYPGDPGFLVAAKKCSSWTDNGDGTYQAPWPRLGYGAWEGTPGVDDRALKPVNGSAEVAATDGSNWWDSVNKTMWYNPHGNPSSPRTLYSNWYWAVDGNGHSYITLYKLSCYGGQSDRGVIQFDRKDDPIISSYFTVDSCRVKYAAVDGIRNGLPGHHYYIVNNTITDFTVGIYIVHYGGSPDNVTISNNYLDCGAPGYYSYWAGFRGMSDRGAIAMQPGDDYKITDNHIARAVDYGIFAFRFSSSSMKNMHILRNRIDEVSDPFDEYYSFGIGMGGGNDPGAGDNTSGMVIAHNIVKNCKRNSYDKNYGIGLRLSTGKHTNPTTRPLVYGNVVTKCDTNYRLNKTSTPTDESRCEYIFHNNVSYFPNYAHSRIDGAISYDLDMSHNIWYPDTTVDNNRFYWKTNLADNFIDFIAKAAADGVIIGENSFVADPLFVDPANGNFHLKPGSPAIDAGVDVGLTEDFEGNPIPQGHTPDIGAYEYIFFPVSVIKNEPKEGRAPLTVTFDGSQSTSSNGNIVSYDWDFADGSTSTGIKTSHIFTSAGEYTVTLRVTDSYGLKGESQIRITVFEKEFGGLPTSCYNNVFNPIKGEKALIVVEVTKQAHVRLNLYNTGGNRIRKLADEQKEAGTHKYYWDGKSGNGDVVGSGLYFVHIQAGDYKKTKKIVVVK